MGHKIDANWNKLNNLAQKTTINIDQLETIRKKMQEITLSLHECWQGTDSNHFITNMSAYLEELKKDTQYLIKWAQLFQKSSLRYHGGVEDGLSKVRQVEEIINHQNPEFEVTVNEQ